MLKEPCVMNYYHSNKVVSSSSLQPKATVVKTHDIYEYLCTKLFLSVHIICNLGYEYF